MNNKKQPLAIALRYEQGTRDIAPKVVAKGRGEVAKKIIATALENGVPLKEEPMLAELLSQVELGDYIPQTLYEAVAAVIAFAYRIRQEKEGLF
jgi:flagellar biosynthesis protein